MANTRQAKELSALGSNLDAKEGAERVRIVLEDNDGIPPTGQFFQIGGTDEQGNRFERAYILRPGVEAEVPVELLDILDHAVMSVPQIDHDTNQVIGYRDRLRFPYRFVNARR